MKSKEFTQETTGPLRSKRISAIRAKRQRHISDSPVANQLQAIADKYEIGDEDYQLMADILNIGKDCKPFLSSVQDHFSLLRGISDGDFFIKQPVRLKGREPLGMSLGMMQTIDKIFNANFGAPFRQSAFCTGSYELASGFGTVYSIFPIGDFKILWSPEVEDLNHALWSFEGDDMSDSDVNDMLDYADYKSTDLNRAIASGNEIMVRAKGYYGICHDELGYEFPIDAIDALIKLGTTL